MMHGLLIAVFIVVDGLVGRDRKDRVDDVTTCLFLSIALRGINLNPDRILFAFCDPLLRILLNSQSVGCRSNNCKSRT